jgi:hypothetical protein
MVRTAMTTLSALGLFIAWGVGLTESGATAGGNTRLSVNSASESPPHVEQRGGAAVRRQRLVSPRHLFFTLPTMLVRGRAPQNRLSFEFVQLSPRTK